MFIPPLCQPCSCTGDESDDRDLSQLEELIWESGYPCSDQQIDQFLIVSRLELFCLTSNRFKAMFINDVAIKIIAVTHSYISYMCGNGYYKF